MKVGTQNVIESFKNIFTQIWSNDTELKQMDFL